MTPRLALILAAVLLVLAFGVAFVLYLTASPHAGAVAAGGAVVASAVAARGLQRQRERLERIEPPPEPERTRAGDESAIREEVAGMTIAELLEDEERRRGG